MKHLQYASYVMRHKWYVFVECCKLGIPLLGIIHDWSKLLPDEWWAYTNHFYGTDSHHGASHEATGHFQTMSIQNDPFDKAWLAHQRRNPHH